MTCTKVEEHEVQTILDKWRGYLREQKIEGEDCYSIYHTSFRDFLKEQVKLKPTRSLFERVNKRITEYLRNQLDSII